MSWYTSTHTGESMKITRSIYSVIICFIVAACTQTPIKTDYDKSVDFSTLKTYAWGDNTLNMEKTGQTVDQVVEKLAQTVTDRLVPAVDNQLAAKGFTLTDKEKPDFIVQYSIKNTVEKIVTREMYAPGAVSTTSAVDKTGTMMLGKLKIYMLKTGTMKLLWRSEMDTIMKFDGKEINRLNRVIDTMFKDFPPNQPEKTDPPQ